MTLQGTLSSFLAKGRTYSYPSNDFPLTSSTHPSSLHAPNSGTLSLFFIALEFFFLLTK